MKLDYQTARESELSYFRRQGTVTQIKADGVSDEVAVGYLLDLGGRFSYKVFAGKQGKPFKFYSAASREQAEQRIREALTGALASHQRAAAYKAQVKETRKKPYHESAYGDGLPLRSYSTAGTAVLIREELKKRFPGITFSVKSSTYAGGSSIDITWTDGPTTAQVDEVGKRYQQGHFDGMQDMHISHGPTQVIDDAGNLHWASYGAKYIHTSRSFSATYGRHCYDFDLRQRPTLTEQVNAFYNQMHRQYSYSAASYRLHEATGNYLLNVDGYQRDALERFASSMQAQGYPVELETEDTTTYLAIYAAALQVAT